LLRERSRSQISHSSHLSMLGIRVENPILCCACV
jgi:hypothetical protein